MTTEQDQIQRQAAREALRAIGQDWTLVICEECNGIGCAGHPPVIGPTLTLAALVGLVMTI